MFDTILTIIVIWFIISIPASVLIGGFLAFSKHPTERDEMFEAPSPVEFKENPLPYSWRSRLEMD